MSKKGFLVKILWHEILKIVGSVRTVVRTVAFPRPPTVEVPCVYLQDYSLETKW